MFYYYAAAKGLKHHFTIKRSQMWQDTAASPLCF